MTKIVPVILAGGSGTRLWPVSNQQTPKQFAQLMSSRSMFQDTLDRFADQELFTDPLIVCAEKHLDLVRQQMKDTARPSAHIIVETAARDSGPAVAAAALRLELSRPDAVLLITPSDHLIEDVAPFQASVLDGLDAAKSGRCVVFGIDATHPETGYGYIKAGAPLAMGGAAHSVVQFVEKPDLKTAQGYLAEGGYFWNSGMVLARADVLIDAFWSHAPEVISYTERALYRSRRHKQTTVMSLEESRRIPAISLDYAVLEQAENTAVTPARFKWSDLGTWAAVSQAALRDELGNSEIGDVELIESKDVYCRAEGLRVAAIGVNDLVIVAREGSVLVTRKDLCQRVKEIAPA